MPSAIAQRKVAQLSELVEQRMPSLTYEQIALYQGSEIYLQQDFEAFSYPDALDAQPDSQAIASAGDSFGLYAGLKSMEDSLESFIRSQTEGAAELRAGLVMPELK